jgi:hypothetical protein
LIAGDGIREGLQSIAELVNRNAAKAFSFGIIEVALYRFGKDEFAIQSRLLAETEVITRQVTLVSIKGDRNLVPVDEPNEPEKPTPGSSTQPLKEWWTPILKMDFRDPEQEPPFWSAPNNVVLDTPFPRILIKAAVLRDRGYMEIFLSSKRIENIDAIRDFIKRDRQFLLDNLPEGTVVDAQKVWPIFCRNQDPLADDDRYAWLKETLNAFVDALRPRLRKWHEQTRA